MRHVRTLACLALLAVLTTCGSAAAGQRTGQPVLHPQWTGCPADARAPAPVGTVSEATSLPLLPSSFVPIAAYACRLEPVPDRAGGRAVVLVEQRATDLAALVAALRLPDQPLGHRVCTAEGFVVPWIAVVDARGRWMRPGVPTDSCGKPRVEVRAALARLNSD